MIGGTPAYFLFHGNNSVTIIIIIITTIHVVTTTVMTTMMVMMMVGIMMTKSHFSLICYCLSGGTIVKPL